MVRRYLGSRNTVQNSSSSAHPAPKKHLRNSVGFVTVITPYPNQEWLHLCCYQQLWFSIQFKLYGIYTRLIVLPERALVFFDLIPCVHQGSHFETCEHLKSISYQNGIAHLLKMQLRDTISWKSITDTFSGVVQDSPKMVLCHVRNLQNFSISRNPCKLVLCNGKIHQNIGTFQITSSEVPNCTNIDGSIKPVYLNLSIFFPAYISSTSVPSLFQNQF